jgi:hypothetical protein
MGLAPAIAQPAFAWETVAEFFQSSDAKERIIAIILKHFPLAKPQAAMVISTFASQLLENPPAHHELWHEALQSLQDPNQILDRVVIEEFLTRTNVLMLTDQHLLDLDFITV